MRDSVRRAANQAAFARIVAVQPAWTAVCPARAALGLADRTLLHAGPPFADPRKPSPPVLSSAVLCCLHEGWASSAQEAEALIAGGGVALQPAQDYGAVVPLAAVISPGSMLVEIVDARHPADKAWSLLGSGAGPQLRFGSRDPAIIERLVWRDTVLARVLQAALARGPVALLPLAGAGIRGGDELHGRTTSATAALRDEMDATLATDADGVHVRAMLERTPLFFLTLWMAACHLMLKAAGHDAAGSSLVMALAGNGETCGLRVAGLPERWFTAAGSAPGGPRINPGLAAETSPVIGDSGVIDMMGFGGQALAHASEVREALAAWLPASAGAPNHPALIGPHPAFGTEGLWTGMDAAAVASQGIAPLAAIAMVGADGRAGLLGRGIYQAPLTLFAQAATALRQDSR